MTPRAANATQASMGPQRPRRGTRRYPRRRLGRGLLHGLAPLTECSNPALLSTLCPESLLRLLLLKHSNIVQQLRFLRVQVGRTTGRKATRRGLLCGHTPGIGGSTAGELLCGSTSKGVRKSAASNGLPCGPAGCGGECWVNCTRSAGV